MAGGGGASQPFQGQTFNGVFLAYLIVCGFLSVLFLLYFNRVFASLVSWGVRTWTWHQYRVYIDIQALQVSLLGGRIFFTGLRYHGNNETILIQNGHITWSYWLRRVRRVKIGKRKDSTSGQSQRQRDERSARMPCRINVTLSGLEWFVYNRSAAYDSLLAGIIDDPAEEKLGSSATAEDGDAQANLRSRASRRDGDTRGSSSDRPSEQANKPESRAGERPHGNTLRKHEGSTWHSSQSDNDKEDGVLSLRNEDDLPFMLQLFPIYMECQKAAVVMGNENTKAVLIVKTKGFTGEIDASETETPDPYRQIFRLNFEHPVVEMRDSEDFKEDQASRATRERQVVQNSPPSQYRSFLRRQRRKAYNQLRNMVPYWRRSVESLSVHSRSEPGTAGTQVPGSSHWQGLSRYLDERDQDEKTRWASVEYAAVSTVLDSPKASLTIYWDVVGKVVPRIAPKTDRSSTWASNINGDEPPAWGITLSIHGGSMNYGPWADRHRAELQRIFFPGLCKDATPAQRLPLGADRTPTQFKLFVEVEDEATVRIPIREDSKNWKWKGKETGPKQPRPRDKRKSRGLFRKSDQANNPVHQRPYGWLDIKIAPNTTISYCMDMVAGLGGYSNTLDLDLPRTEISSSINHELLWRSGPQRIKCDLSAPLKWNGLRQWRFDVVGDDLDLFLLRDHVFLLTDLVDDWASGPPPEYLVFTPFKYHMDFQQRNVTLYLNVNDANIVDNPTDFDDNTYIVIASPSLQSNLCVPIDKYRPPKNAIPFDVRAETASLRLHVPSWNTQAAFSDSTDIGHLENLVVEGQYHYNATTSPLNTDTLVLNVSGQSPVATLHGFVIRYFLKLKDNYFGDDVHFKTLEEFQESLRLKESDPDAERATRPPPKKSNDLDVILSIRADDPKVVLPANLYSSSRHIQIDTACLSADARFTNYYMDLDLLVTPLNLSLGSADDGMTTPMSATSTTQLFIDGVTVYGHRTFGLPPTEPTYLCNWDISAGAVTGECTADFLTALMSGGKSLGFSFDDDENALIPYSSIVFYDITFLRAFVQSIHIWLHVEDAAFLFSTRSIDVNYNDWARSHYSKRADIKIPDVCLSCVNSESAARHKSRGNYPVETDALLQTSVHLAIVTRKFGFSNERKLQQELVRREDQRTHRTEFLLVPGVLEDLIPDPVEAPAQSVPPIPLPRTAKDVHEDVLTLSSEATSRHSKEPQRKSSFISFSSSSHSSIVRPQSSKRSSVGTRHREKLQPLTAINRQGDDNGGPKKHAREVSVSTGRHSAFYSAYADLGDRQDLVHNTVAFSSQYFAPYFPLENVQPDARELAAQSVEDDDKNAHQPDFEDFDLGDIDPDILNEDCAYSSTIVELPSGVTGFLNPSSLRSIAALLSALQPADPEDVLDSLQLKAMDDIFAMQKEQKMKGRVKDLALRLPRANIRFINSAELDSTEPPQEGNNLYDFSIMKLALASRTESKWDDPSKWDSRQSRESFHLRVESVEFSAAERFASAEEPQAAVMVQVQNVMVSLGSRDLTYLDADIGSVQGSMASEKIEYLAALIHQTSSFATDLGRLFSRTLSREKQVTRFLAHKLVTEGQGAVDPSFLIRPSAVLRSAKQHLRTFDSWKMMARLRQMWAMLATDAKERLKMQCMGDSLTSPDDVRAQVVSAFQRWRSWDLENVSESSLLRNIFGKQKSHIQQTPDEVPVLAVVRLRESQLVLDPGPKQNEITFIDLTVRAETQQDTVRRQSSDTEVGGGSLAVFNVYCGDVAVSLNWELCELADDVLRLYNRIRVQSQPQMEDPQPEASRELHRGRTVHCVLALGRGSVAVETINLHASSLCTSVKASVLLSNDSRDLHNTNLILSCDTVGWRIRSHSQALSKFQLQGPSVFFSHELQTTNTTYAHTIKATASSKDFSLIVRQDPIVLMEVLDLLVKDEVSQLYRFKTQLLSSSDPGPSTSSGKKIVDRLSAFRVNLAMFMNRYTISLPLLRSLTYTISGTVSRAAMAANFGREIIFDFDVKENSHEMQININNVPRSISLLQIPPTNGRITSHMGHGEHSITVFASVELVQLDASAVYSLLSALNRPEISNAISDLQQQGKIIQEHVEEVFGRAQKTKNRTETSPDSVLAYSVHLTFAGLEVFGNSPLKSEAEPMAHLSFSLDSVHLEAANRLEQQGPILAYPEAHVNLRQVHFGIQKGKAGSMHSCGNVAFGALITATSKPADDGQEKRFFNVKSDGSEVNLSPDTVSTVVDVLGYMGDKIKDLDTSRELEYLRKLRQSRPRIAINDQEEEDQSDIIDSFLSSITYTFEIRDIQMCWLVSKPGADPTPGKDDLILSLQMIEFGTRTRNSARLTIENLQLQMASPLQDRRARSANSALMPEIIFNIAYVSTPDARRLAFQAVGKSLDLRLTSGFIIPAANLNDSIGLSIKNAQQASRHWNPVISAATPEETPEKPADQRQRSILGSRRLESLLVDADFAGAVVYITSKRGTDEPTPSTTSRSGRPTLPGKYGQFSQEDSGGSTVLRSPGLAWKMEYRDSGKEDPSLYAVVKIDASSNILYPSVVPLIMDMTSSVKEIVSDDADSSAHPQEALAKVKTGEEENILTADPSAVLGRLKLNLGLRICRQEFSLSCQPIARVAATASFEDVYFTVNTVHSVEHGNFFAISGAFSKLQASVQHVYSRESTGSFEVDSIVLSLMNSKHVSGTSGVSAILKVSPMKVSVNAKQLQDFLLFREIWLPREIRQFSTTSPAPVPKLATETSQSHLVQRYQQVAATAAFPWTATISISALEINVDLGQSLGKSVFAIEDFWVSSKKTSDWEQNLCLGFQRIGVDSTGRMSGFVALQNFRLRTSIQWPERERALSETPLIQASVGFSELRVKAAFDYQAFLVADITSMELLMYNVRRSRDGGGDRLVAVFDGDAVQVMGTTSSAAQGLALYQAFQKLVQERKTNFETSLREIERFLKRRSLSVSSATAAAAAVQRLSLAKAKADDDALSKSPISLDTDVVVTLKALNLGFFPSTFSDHQVFKMEALDASARFQASIVGADEERRRIHSTLALTLGQLRIGLAAVKDIRAPKALSELSVEDVVQSSTGSRGGTILKVPRVSAVMETWQPPAGAEAKHIDYIFKSAFEGKVEVGWNYSRVSYIRGMWASHSRALAQTWGRELPLTAIKVTGVPEAPDEEARKGMAKEGDVADGDKEQQQQQANKITAEVKVPQSRYEYHALEPPVIETPQLRDMGEATPPLEWIGLHRDRLPNLTHQIVIVSLLELAGEVEDAYSRILGSS